MIRKNIDIIAICVLLFGIAVYSRAREVKILEVIPSKRIALAQEKMHGKICPVFSAFQQLRRIQLLSQ